MNERKGKGEYGRRDGRAEREAAVGDNGRCFFSTSVCPFPRFNSSFFSPLRAECRFHSEMGRDDHNQSRSYVYIRTVVGLDILVAKKDGGAYSPSSAPNGLDYFMFRNGHKF